MRAAGRQGLTLKNESTSQIGRPRAYAGRAPRAGADIMLRRRPMTEGCLTHRGYVRHIIFQLPPHAHEKRASRLPQRLQFVVRRYNTSLPLLKTIGLFHADERTQRHTQMTESWTTIPEGVW